MSRSVIFLSKEKWQGPPARARCSLFVPWEMNVLAASKLGAVLKKKQGPAECRSCRLALSVLPLHQLASSLLLPASLKEGKKIWVVETTSSFSSSALHLPVLSPAWQDCSGSAVVTVLGHDLDTPNRCEDS